MTLAELQTKIKKSKLNALFVTRNNQFIGQDILDEENIILNLTNFSGSKGTLLVFAEKAYLFVDGRYEIQAKLETNPQYVEVICGKHNVLNEWLLKHVNSEQKTFLGYNPWCHTVHEIEKLQDFAAASLPKLKFEPSEILPPLLISKETLVFEHKLEFSGITAEEKIADFCDRLERGSLDAYFIAAADSVSWLLNIRSNLLPHSPVVRAMALVNKQGQITVFSSHKDLSLPKNIKILPLEKVEKELSAYKKKKVNCCFYAAPSIIADFFKKYKIEHQSQIDPCQVMKAEKNLVELEGTKQAHLRDGVSMVKFLYWLENNWQGKTEIDAAAKLYDFRKSNQNFFSESFGAIVGAGANAAIIHYRPTELTNQPLTEGVLLIDSGAQYLDGTTDITRTIAIGNPKQEIKDNFTYVLKAHIALSSSIFPVGTNGMSIDILSRRELWQKGLVYNHGTGHGVGHFLNVHEGPQNISSGGTHYPLKENMVLSIEPGFYQEGEYGIRIENLVYVAPSVMEGFLRFVNLTYVPIDKNLINVELLDSSEINWLNNYHAEVYKKISPYLEEGEREWLKNSCSPL